MNMYTYNGKAYNYEKALGVKHPLPDPIAKKYHTKQTEINMKFDTVEDVAGFAATVFDSYRERVFTNEPDFMNPRTLDRIRKDYSENCIVM